jgi:hemolysin D
MVIVPDAASVSAGGTPENKDIGFVAPGQDVAVKLETFPFTRYGTVKASVDKVTQDAVSDEKRVGDLPGYAEAGADKHRHRRNTNQARPWDE